MTSAFANLRPSERRLVIVVGVILFIVINWVWVVPHFSDWSVTTKRMEDARWKLETYQKEIAKKSEYEGLIRKLGGEEASVPPENQAVQFALTVQRQAAQSRVSILGNSRPSVRTNQFFIEQFQTITVQGEEKNLVDFLFNLGDGALIRVRGLSAHPDAPRQLLAANITLGASYQKNLSLSQPVPAPAAAAKPAPAPAPVPETPKTSASAPALPALPNSKPVPNRPNVSTNHLKRAINQVAPVKK